MCRLRPQFEVRRVVDDETPVRHVRERRNRITADRVEPIGGRNQPAVDRHGGE
jgi:hypothetical protein